MSTGSEEDPPLRVTVSPGDLSSHASAPLTPFGYFVYFGGKGVRRMKHPGGAGGLSHGTRPKGCAVVTRDEASEVEVSS